MPIEQTGGMPPRVRPSKSTGRRETSFRLKASFTCVSPASHGEIVVIEEGDRGRDGYVVGWRRDRRFRRGFTRLSVFHDRQSAISNALSLSCRYIPQKIQTTRHHRDSQKSSVYEWERKLSPNLPSDIASMRAEVGKACSFFGVADVQVSAGGSRLTRFSYFTPSRGIVVANGMQDTATVRHELAHYLVWRMGISEASHGPAFVSTLIAVHVILGDIDAKSAARLAQDAGIEMNTHLLQGLLNFGSTAAKAA